jgi:hypothetical protein
MNRIIEIWVDDEFYRKQTAEEAGYNVMQIIRLVQEEFKKMNRVARRVEIRSVGFTN